MCTFDAGVLFRGEKTHTRTQSKRFTKSV